MVKGGYLQLNQVKAYCLSYHLSNYVWEIVCEWNYFSRDTLGKQFARSIDSISANVAEGFGRYNKKDKIRFYRFSRGSVYESLDWVQKAKMRNLITEEQYNYIFKELKLLPREINSLIKYTNQKLTI